MNTKTAIIAPLRIKRPVMARRPRAIGQEVFKEIVKMAYEMDRAQKILDQKDAPKRALRDLVERAKAVYQEVLSHRLASISDARLYYKVTIELESDTYRRVVMESGYYQLEDEERYHTVQIEANWNTVRGELEESGTITFYDQDGNYETDYEYSSRKGFFRSLTYASEDYYEEIKEV